MWKCSGNVLPSWVFICGSFFHMFIITLWNFMWHELRRSVFLPKSMWNLQYKSISVHGMEVLQWKFDLLPRVVVLLVHELCILTLAAEQSKHTCCCLNFNSLQPGDTYLLLQTGSSMDQEMTCLLFGVKPFPESVLTYCQLDPHDVQISLIFSFPLNKVTLQWCHMNIMAF